MFAWPAAWAAVTGSISGTVKDPAGRVVPNADVTAREGSTGTEHKVRSDANGYYTLPALPVGRYDLDVRATGFESYERKDIVLDTDASLTLDCPLKVGAISQTVSVTDNALHVETVSTQSGEVITGRQTDGGAAERAQLYRSAGAAAGGGSGRQRSARRRWRTWARRFWTPRER